MTELWLVFQYRDDAPPDFQGVFSTKQKAIEACKSPNYCVCGPAVVDQELPEETSEFPKGWYPLLESEPESDPDA